MPESALPVEYLFTITAQTVAPVMMQNGPQGTRVIVGVTGGTFEGPKLKGTVAANGGGDYLTSRADGSVKLDVRIVLNTDDGAVILMTYNGIGLTRDDGSLSLRTAPLFETGDERYSWLNRVQAVATGAPGRGDVSYTVYALK
jgi:hypothetical protein